MSQPKDPESNSADCNQSAALSVCVVCAEDILNYAIASCTPSHPVCSRCVTRLRYLQKDNRCPVCRTELKWVLFAPKLLEWSQDSLSDGAKSVLELREKFFRLDETFSIVFHSKSNYDEFLELTTIKCKVCLKVIRTDDELKTHLRKMHEKKLCEICLVHLNRFPNEYVYYDRSQLAVHNKSGDKETLGLKGHPMCEFCQKRFLDSDELECHQRRDHYYCHFCADQGFVEFFPDPYFLKSHYKKYHILCEEGDCADDYGFFTSVFNNEVDFQAHRLKEHGKSYSKKIRDQLKQIPLHFETPHSRSANQNESNSGRYARGGAGYQRNNYGSSGDSRYGGMDQYGEQQPHFTSHNRQNQPRSSQHRTRYGRDRRMYEDIPSGNSYSRANSSAIMAASPPKVDLNVAPSERGFFDTPTHKANTPRSEGVPLSEQHMLATTIATAVGINDDHISANGMTVNGAKSEMLTTNDPSQNGQTDQEDFPDLPGASGRSTNFWSAFNTTSMRGVDRLQETHFPALPQSEAPSTKKGKKKNGMLQLHANRSTVWGSAHSQHVNGAVSGLHKVESSPAMLQNTQSSSRTTTCSPSLGTSLFDQGSGVSSSSMETSSPSQLQIHPNYLVVRPKTKGNKKKRKNKNDPDETVSSIKSILSSVGSELEAESRLLSAANDSSGDAGLWSSFENSDLDKSSQAVVDNEVSTDLSFNGLKLTEIDEPKRNGNVRTGNFEGPPGLGTGKQPLLELPPGFEPSPRAEKSKSEDVAQSVQGGATISNAKKEANRNKDFEYFCPPDFDIRNRKLNAMIHQLLVNRTTGDERLYHEFLRLSKSFSRSQGSANAVLNFCKYNFGDNFYLVFTEVLCLLPNIGSQQKLLAAFRKQNSTRDKNLDENVTSCEICSQVLAYKDQQQHLKGAHCEETSESASSELKVK